MSWYNDPENLPPSTTPPAGPPPGFQPPPAAPNAQGMQLDGTPPAGPTPSSRRALAVGALVVSLLLLGAVGMFVGSKLLGGPEQVSMRRYARAYCKEVQRPSEAALKKVLRDPAIKKFNAFSGDSSWTEARTEELLRTALPSLLDVGEKGLDLTQSFNDSYILSGSDGKDLREELGTAIKDDREQLASVRKDLAELDPADQEDAVKDAGELLNDGRLNAVTDVLFSAGDGDPAEGFSDALNCS